MAHAHTNLPSKKTIIAELCLAIINEDSTTIEKLLADPDLKESLKKIKTNSGHSPLYFAVRKGNPIVCQKLVEKGASLNETFDGASLIDVLDRSNVATENRRLIRGMLLENNIKAQLPKIEVKDTSQKWIIEPLIKSGYLESEGYCHGVSLMGAQALLIDNRDKNNNLIELMKFYQRVEYLKDKNNVDAVERIQDTKLHRTLLIELIKPQIERLSEDNLNSLLKKLQASDFAKLDFKQKKQLALQLTVDGKMVNQDRSMIDLPAFLDGVALYQKVTEYDEVIKHSDLKLDKVIPVIPVVASPMLKAVGGMCIAKSYSGVYSKDDLKYLLYQMSELAEKNNYQSPVVMKLSANNHAITVAYDPMRKEWMYIDANKDIPILYSAEAITHAIRAGLFAELNKPLLLTTNILCTGYQAQYLKNKVLDPLEKTQIWNEVNKVDMAKMQFTDKKGLSLKEAAIWAGDVSTSQQIVAIKRNKKSFFSKHKTAIAVGGGILLGAALIAGSVLTMGLLPAAIATGIMLAAIPTAIAIIAVSGGSLGIKKISAKKSRVEKIHEVKSAGFNAALKEYKHIPENTNPNAPTKESKVDASTTGGLLKKLEYTNNPDSILTLKQFHEEQREQQTFLSNNALLQRSYSQLDLKQQVLFMQVLCELPNQDMQVNFLLFNQTLSDLQNFQTRIRQMQGTDISYATSLKKDDIIKCEALIDKAMLLEKPYDINDSNKRLQFRELFFNLNDDEKNYVLKTFQPLDSLQRLKDSFDKLIRMPDRDLNEKLVVRAIEEKTVKAEPAAPIRARQFNG